MEERTNLGAVTSNTVVDNQLEKQAFSLESRLDKAFVKYNKALDLNEKFRLQIDGLRRNRVVYGITCSRIEKELVDIKKRISEIIECSSNSYETR
jgi:hypothetical protein